MSNLLNNSDYISQLKESAQMEIEWEYLKNKTILITGATGMIGTYLVDLFMYKNQFYNTQIKVIAVSRNKDRAELKFQQYMDNKFFKYISHDINRPIDFDEKSDFIIQAASNTHPIQYANDPIGTITTNIIGTKNILDYGVKVNVSRVIFLSSVEIYGESYSDVKAFDENSCGYIDCNTLRAGYPESKRVGESLCQAYIKKYHMDIVIPRLSRVYGPNMLKSDSKAIAQFIKNAINKEEIVLKSEGTQLYSYTYVSDAISAILYILCFGEKGEAYNVSGAESTITLKDLAKLIANKAGTEVKFESPNPIEQSGYSKATKAVLCTKKLESLNWNSKYSIREGLSNTMSILAEVYNED